MFCPVKAIGKTVATERRMERDMKYITKNLDFQLDKRSVVTLGKFDGVHKGHSKLINRVLEIGKEGYETVVFTFDVSPLVRLGTRIKRTILTNEERRILLERRGVECLVECPFVPEIIRMEPEDFIREILVKQLRAAYVVVGPDFHFGHNRMGDYQLLLEYADKFGYEVQVIEKIQSDGRDISSTYIREYIKEGNIEEAYKVISESSALPAVCGRVCPQETQCEQKCIRGIKGEAISIGKLERFVADWARENGIKPEPAKEMNGHKVAVIGSGPSGVTAAGDLAKMGYDVTIFEALHQPGGVLVYGIPEFRLPKEKVVAKEIENIKSLGVKIETNVVVGKSVTIDSLLEDEGFDAVFIGSGAGLPKFMGIPGENANGVFSANEYLTRSNLMKAFDENSNTPIMRGKKVAVVGGGNVAMDAARTALRLGAETHIVYRRSEEELPARVEEVHHAKEEGIIFDLLTNPTEILEDENGWVCGMKCVKMELGEPDASGRRRPVVIPDSEFTMDVDTVIMSLGTSPNPLISSTTEGLETNKWKCIIAEESNGQTTKEGVYAGGDGVTGAATVILAMEAGRAGAKGIDEYIKNNK